MNNGSSNDLHIERVRRIAVDVRPRSFGFVVFENAIVLDGGVRTCDQGQPQECLLGRFRALLMRYDPAVVILRATSRSCARNTERDLLSTLIRKTVRSLAIDLSFTSDARLNLYFSHHRATTKHEIATVVARLLPALEWQLPPKRRAWDSEPYWASVFDAAAIAVPHIFPALNKVDSNV